MEEQPPQRFDGNILWGSASSWDSLSGSWNCSHPHPTHCHSVPAPSRPWGNRKLQMAFAGRWCLCMGGNTRTDMKKKKAHWFTSGQSNVTFQISRLKSVAWLSISILGLENIFPTVSFTPLRPPSPFCFLAFSFFQCCGVSCLGFLSCLGWEELLNLMFYHRLTPLQESQIEAGWVLHIEWMQD